MDYVFLQNSEEMRCAGRNRIDETVISRLRFGHSGLNSTLFKTGQHNTVKTCYSASEVGERKKAADTKPQKDKNIL